MGWRKSLNSSFKKWFCQVHPCGDLENRSTYLFVGEKLLPQGPTSRSGAASASDPHRSGEDTGLTSWHVPSGAWGEGKAPNSRYETWELNLSLSYQIFSRKAHQKSHKGLFGHVEGWDNAGSGILKDFELDFGRKLWYMEEAEGEVWGVPFVRLLVCTLPG